MQAFDSVALNKTVRICSDRRDLQLCADKYAALQGADALAICTEWQEFRAPNFDEMQSRLIDETIVDGRNLYASHRQQAKGWTYISVGRRTGEQR